MKALLEVVELKVMDVITTSTGGDSTGGDDELPEDREE